jgi:hypothetical protein
MMFRSAVMICCALAVLSACKKQPPEPQSSPEIPLVPSAAPAPTPLPTMSAAPAAKITWVDPPEWKRVKGSPVRQATYQVPRAKGDSEDGELAVFYFGPGESGGIEKNVERWVKQFSEVPPERVKREERNANGLHQHTVSIESGTFSSGMPGGPTKPKTGYALLGAIVEAPSGNYFFKLTGPSATVKASHETFYELLDGIKTAD